MSTPLIARSPDLARLQTDGLDVRIVGGALIIGQVPYVRPNGTVAYGTLACALDLSGDVTVAPTQHTIFFAGEKPHDERGVPLDLALGITEFNGQIGGVEMRFQFSAKPVGNKPYEDYHQKITTYLRRIVPPAERVNPEAAVTRAPLRETTADESVFLYPDTFATRAGIEAANNRLSGQRVAIIGCGGTGSAILDLVAKTPVAEVHLYDGDDFLTHNAFRAPGWTSLDELRGQPTKVDLLAARYGVMRRGVIPHAVYVTAENIDQLAGFDVVFIAIDKPAAKRAIFEYLTDRGALFIDSGMGLTLTDDHTVRGQVRVTTSAPGQHDHVARRVSLVDFGDDDYRTNIQIVELNSIAANLAVLRWKKHYGFYEDASGEHNTTFVVGTGQVVTGDHTK
jgi:hypothetical protein